MRTSGSGARAAISAAVGDDERRGRRVVQAGGGAQVKSGRERVGQRGEPGLAGLQPQRAAQRVHADERDDEELRPGRLDERIVAKEDDPPGLDQLEAGGKGDMRVKAQLPGKTARADPFPDLGQVVGERVAEVRREEPHLQEHPRGHEQRGRQHPGVHVRPRSRERSMRAQGQQDDQSPGAGEAQTPSRQTAAQARRDHGQRNQQQTDQEQQEHVEGRLPGLDAVEDRRGAQEGRRVCREEEQRSDDHGPIPRSAQTWRACPWM
jgi:hypothetical protein